MCPYLRSYRRGGPSLKDQILDQKINFSKVIIFTVDQGQFEFEPNRPLCLPLSCAASNGLTLSYAGSVSTLMAQPDFLQYPAYHRPILPTPLQLSLVYFRLSIISILTNVLSLGNARVSNRNSVVLELRGNARNYGQLVLVVYRARNCVQVKKKQKPQVTLTDDSTMRYAYSKIV